MKCNNLYRSKKDKGGRHSVLLLLVCIICVVVACAAVWQIVSLEVSYKVAVTEYSELYDDMPFSDKALPADVLRQAKNVNGGKGKTPTGHANVQPAPMDPMEVAFHLKEISHLCSDLIGWIDFDTLPISYPLVQGESNDTYLRTTFKGTNAPAGSIFMEALNNADFSDRHTIIYGHNMKNGSMFGQLKKYEASDFLEENKYFTIYTPGGELFRYEIISCMKVPLDSKVYQIYFDDEEDYCHYLQMIGYGGIDAPQSITLSTCAGSDKSYRLVVNAVKIGDE